MMIYLEEVGVRQLSCSRTPTQDERLQMNQRETIYGSKKDGSERTKEMGGGGGDGNRLRERERERERRERICFDFKKEEPPRFAVPRADHRRNPTHEGKRPPI